MEFSSAFTVVRVSVCLCMQKEKPKQSANLSLFASDSLFVTDDDSPTFDLFLPSSVSTFYYRFFLSFFYQLLNYM